MAIAGNERELRSRFMDAAGEIFGAQHWGIHLLDDACRALEVDVHGLPDTFISRYEEVGRAIDPIMQFVMERHSPAHEQLVLTTQGWKQSALYQNICAYYDHDHIMTGPIVGGGRLIGTVHFSRGKHTPAFDAEDLTKVGALCAHLSACLATLRVQSARLESPWVNRLTQRELQIADLVAQGLTNAEIGAALWITQNSVKQALKRIFRKLDVSSRTEVVAKLSPAFGVKYPHRR
jgi:DNA-binding CsgD family transcriptional regulator